MLNLIRKSKFYRIYKKCEAVFYALKFGFPTKGVKCIGITGTDGKTTTNEMIYHIMKSSGKKVGIMSTISMDIGNGKGGNLSRNKLTTLTHKDFQKYMKLAKKNGLEYMVIEPSSHAIFQYRFWPAKFIAVGITNLTHEHLDFHGTMEHYFNTKSEIFYKWLLPNSFGIYPHNFHYKKELQEKSKVSKLWEFGQDKNSDLWAEQIKYNPEISADIQFKDGDNLAINSQLIGNFNLDNIMIAVAICKNIGITNSEIQNGIKTFAPPAGRVETIKTPDNITIVIDFALTPNALTKLYQSFKTLSYTKQTAIFGATGDRDKQKRPIMGKIATENNDFVIITEDENYSENGEEIISQIESGIDKSKHQNYKIIQDRKEAIKYAIENAKSGEVILLTGMGNFNTRKMGNKQIPRNDKEIVEEILKNNN